MACRTMLRSAALVQPFLPRPCIFHFNLNQFHHKPSRHKLTLIAIGSRRFHPPKPSLSSSHNETPPSHDEDEDPPQQAVLKAISEVSKTEGRVGHTTNVIVGDTAADDSTNEWLALDQKVNSYPMVRGFTAIGTGGEDFVQAMVVAVESVIEQPIPQGCVKQKSSSGGKYVSVNIGPIQVVSSEQVHAVYNAMRRDDRVKYFL